MEENFISEKRISRVAARSKGNYGMAEMISQLANNTILNPTGVGLTDADINGLWEASRETSQGEMSQQYDPFDPFSEIPSVDQLKSLDDIDAKAQESYKTSGVNYLNRENGWEQFLDIIYVPLNAVTSTLITAGNVFQDLRTLNIGKNANAENLAEAWDWTDDNHIDFGTALMYFIGNSPFKVGIELALAPVDRIINLVTSSEQKNTFNTFATEWGLNALTRDFNIFDEKQRAASSGENGMFVNVGTVFTQLFNFAGELVIDPMNLIPFGKLGTLMAGAMKISQGATVKSILGIKFKASQAGHIKAVEETIKVLDGGVEGISSLIAEKNGLAMQLQGAYKHGQKFTEKGRVNVSATYVRETVFKGAIGGEADRAASLMSMLANKAASEDEAIWLMANALAATEMGSRKAFINIATRFSDDFVLIKGLDDIQPNGDFLRRMDYRQAIFDPEDFAGTAAYDQAKSYETLINNVRMQETKNNPIIRTLLGTSEKLVDGEIVTAGGMIREYTAFDSRILGGTARALESKKASYRAWKLGDIGDGAAQYMIPTVGGKFYHIVSAPFRTSQRKVGLRNQIDIANGDVDRLASWLLRADAKLKGALVREGLVAKTLADYRNAGTAAQRKTIIEEFENQTLEKIAISKGISSAQAKALTNSLATTRSRYERTMKRNGYALIDGELVFDKNIATAAETAAETAAKTAAKTSATPITPAQMDEVKKLYNAWDWDKVVSAIGQDQSFAWKTFAQGKDAALQAAAFVQRNWASFVLLRPPRLTRELIQGFPTALISGELKNGWKSGNMRDAIKNVLKTNLAAAQSVSHIVKNIVGKDASEAEVSKSIKTLSDDMKATDKTIDSLTTNILELLDKPYTDFTPEDKKLFELLVPALQSETLFHTTTAKISADKLRKTKLVSSYSSKEDAAIFKAQYGTRINLRSSKDITKLKQAITENKIVQTKGPNGEWESVNPDIFNSEIPKIKENKGLLANAEIRIIDPKNMPKTISYVNAGKNLDLSDYSAANASGFNKAMGILDAKEFGLWVTSGQWKKPAVQKKMITWAEKNGVGKFNVSDKSSASGRTTLSVPNFIASDEGKFTDATLKKILADSVKSMEGKTLSVPSVVSSGSKKARAKVFEEGRAISSETRRLGEKSTANIENLEDLVEKLILLKSAKKQMESMKKELEITGAHINSKQVSLQKPEGVYGGSINSVVKDAYGNDQEVTYDSMLGGGRGRVTADTLTVGIGAEARTAPTGVRRRKHTIEVGLIEGNDIRYFEGQANVLNTHFRDADGIADPITLLFAQGKSRKQVLRWLRTTPEGAAYRREMVGIKHKGVEMDAVDLEEFVATRYTNHTSLFFDDEITEAFLRDETFTSEWLQARYGSYPDKPTIIGQLSNPIEYQSFADRAGQFVGQLQEILSDVPTRNIYGKPIVHAVYRREMDSRIEMFLQNNKRMPNVKEQKAMMTRANSAALTEMRKYVYNAGNTTNFAETMRWFVPFINAQIFVAKSIAAGSFNNPQAVVWLAYSFNKALQSMQWVDESGNPADNPQEAIGLVFQMDEKLAKIMEDVPWLGDYFKYTKQIVVSKNTLDPVFAGNYIPLFGGEIQIPNPFSPGFGPFVTMPVSELVKAQPDHPFWKWVAEGSVGTGFEGLLPFGASKVPFSIDMLVPGRAIEYAVSKQFETGDWLQLYAQMMIYETGRFATGDRDTEPTANDVRDLTNRIYDMKFNTNFWTLAPVSQSIKTEYDLARQLLFRYREAYGQRDGELRFLIEHPDLVYATQSTAENKFDVNYTVNQVKQLQENEALVREIAGYGDAAVDMLSFILEPEENFEFSQPAYAWLASKGHIKTADPEDLRQRTLAKYGWASFRRGMDQIDALAVQKGTTIESDDELNGLRKALIARITNNKDYGDAWKQEYATIDPTRRAVYQKAFDRAMDDPAWAAKNANRPEIRAINAFLDMRTNIANTLIAKRQSGQPYTLSQNPTLKRIYDGTVSNLKRDNIIFADFYNRYFEGDRVTS